MTEIQIIGYGLLGCFIAWIILVGVYVYRTLKMYEKWHKEDEEWHVSQEKWRKSLKPPED